MRPINAFFSSWDDRALKNLDVDLWNGSRINDGRVAIYHHSAIAPKPMMPIRSTVAAKIINPLQNPKHCRERTSERSLIFVLMSLVGPRVA